MNALIKFYQRGADDADRRIARALSPRPLEAADRYLMSSLLVRSFDRLTRVFQSTAARSQAGSAVSAAHGAWQQAAWAERYRTIGLVLIVSMAVHVAAMLMDAQPPGWYRLIVPALVTLFAALLLVASRSTHAGS